MDKVPILPPDTITPGDIPIDTLPHDGENEREYIMKEKFANWKSKTILRSRTIVTIVVTILGFALTKFFGLDVDLGMYIEAVDGLQLGELVLTAGALVAAVFRRYAKADLSTPSNG